MKHAGFASSVAKAGVKTKKLAEISSCSEQMARRYVLGESLPNIDIIYKIAAWLSISPGWLVFGDHNPNSMQNDSRKFVKIELDILEYVLVQSYQLVMITKDVSKVTALIMDVIHNVIQIQADKAIIMQIIDTYVQAAIKFSSDLNNNID